ncbi:uncharacterized protein LOC117652540 [Thrips palmi]|uniref:Uncharacterized protein LOC117652540 n=1 Tax=Thrips palmi TaxID=161013 RepID=A0A6P9A634_THRPL|nr:uncharacterized protein LOC117652540 [Thrips palmi]XP_034253418.1 uncharacterized protein LOC117652540 [Thrips palmi]XP_034253419.1 uncharacterized protein LOC117652540 [Thrips palmi]XP_034253420.1 uncharacterized protein LOC117652540 [Thrips palmi]XP_034253421.1 uncharacterized protein LOC117652540 [Thrips palmi]XP_034253422.1 uncharacterized protein LOC117652540 [Thrips palmi]XP_034253423.1 uncharacterized protein LOC117652540 [Thrips palmi]XP_034253425.1 uncharacterized protein LOC1176
MAPGAKRRNTNEAGPSHDGLGVAAKQMRQDAVDEQNADVAQQQAAPQGDADKWSAMRLRCSSKTMRDEAALQDFLATLAEAPQLAALELSLGNRPGTRTALLQVLVALHTATPRIKELVLTFGEASLDSVIALLGRVRGHLEKLVVSAPYQHAAYDAPGALQRFWTALEETGLTTLELPGYCLNLQGSTKVKLVPAKWRLQSLSVTFGPPCTKRTLLPALIRANAKSLRKAKVGGVSMHPTDLAAAFTALAACKGLVDATVPCCKSVAVLEGCAELTKIDFTAAHLLMAGTAGEDVRAVAKVLAKPAVAERVDDLTLTFFKFGVTKQLAQGLYKSVRGMRKLKTLSVAFCTGFPSAFKNILKSQPLLEHLHLDDGDEPAWQPRVLADITPANAPCLKSVRLHPGLLSEQGKLQDAARAIEQRFAAAGRPVEVVLGKRNVDRPDDSSDEEDDDEEGAAPNPGCAIA